MLPAVTGPCAPGDGLQVPWYSSVHANIVADTASEEEPVPHLPSTPLPRAPGVTDEGEAHEGEALARLRASWTEVSSSLAAAGDGGGALVGFTEKSL